MLRLMFALALGMHGVGHVLFVANSWGYWKTAAGRSWVFADLLHAGQGAEGVIGLLWLVPLIGFVAASWSFIANDPRWPFLALSAGVMSSIMLLIWWSSLNVSSTIFALLFNIVVMIGVLWQQPHLIGR